MITSNPVLFTIICVFSFQAIALSLLNYYKKPKDQAQVFLVILVFFCAIMPLNIVLVNILKDRGLMHIFRFVQLEMLYGIGPALYFYTKSITSPGFKFDKKDWIHFLPLVLEFIYYRTALYREGSNGLYLNPMPGLSYVYLAEQWIGVLSILTYSLFSLRLLYTHQNLLKQYYSKLGNRTLTWLQLPIYCFAGFFILYNIIGEIDRFFFDRTLRTYYFLPSFVGLSFACTWLSFITYINQTEPSLGIKVLGKQKKPSFKKDQEFMRRLELLMQEQQPYLNPELNLSLLSELLEMKPKKLSEKINQSYEQNFYDLINHYRVEAFKKQVKTDLIGKLSLLGIAYECGFNSKSSFNHVFKKKTQMTPSQYLKKVQMEAIGR